MCYALDSLLSRLLGAKTVLYRKKTEACNQTDGYVKDFPAWHWWCFTEAMMHSETMMHFRLCDVCEPVREEKIPWKKSLFFPKTIFEAIFFLRDSSRGFYFRGFFQGISIPGKKEACNQTRMNTLKIFLHSVGCVSPTPWSTLMHLFSSWCVW